MPKGIQVAYNMKHTANLGHNETFAPSFSLELKNLTVFWSKHVH